MTSRFSVKQQTIAAILLSAAVWPFVQHPGVAQIAPAVDGTNTSVNQVNNTFNINGGTQAGTNLFHSFQQFGLNPEQVANFLANPTIANILSRVTGGNVSIIQGQIQVTGSNANLYLMNPAGIVFGANASLNVPGSFTATTANGIGVGNGWFNATGNNNYAALIGNPNQFALTALQPGTIVNAGNLAVEPGQSITLLGGTVINTGTLTAPGGTVTIAAVPGGKLVRINQAGSLLSLDLPTETRAVLNPATVTPVSLPALLTGGNLGNATGLTVQDGAVKLTGSGVTIPTEAGVAIASNQIDVSGTTGGTVNVLGNKVGVVSATIHAAGTNGGGTVLIGGDYKGQGTVPNAQQTYVSRDSVINVDALQSGNGGRAIVWADNSTRFYGTINARGGAQSGNGGFVEVSGKQNLMFDGGVDVQAPAGAAGQLLLDPASVVIGTDGTNDNEFNLANVNPANDDREILASDAGGTFFISVDRLVQALRRGDVTIAAGVDITITSEIVDTDFANLSPDTELLTFTAPLINLNANIRVDSNILFNGNVVLGNPAAPFDTTIIDAAGDVTFSGNLNNAADGVTRNLRVQPLGNLTVTGAIGNTNPLNQLDISGDRVSLRNITVDRLAVSNVRTLFDVNATNDLNLNFVGSLFTDQLRIATTGDLTLNNASSGDLSQATLIGRDVTLNGTALSSFRASSSVTITAQRDLTLQDGSDAFGVRRTELEFDRINATAGRNFTIQNAQIDSVQDTQLVAQTGTLRIQDANTRPVSFYTGNNLTLQGATIDIQALNDRQSFLLSRENFTLISNGVITVNGRLISYGNLAAQTTTGTPGNVVYAPVSSNGIISANGNVSFGNYSGPSLKVEASGSITGGSITITEPNPTLTGTDPDIAILENSRSVILRAGLGELQLAPNVLPSNLRLRNTPTLPPDRTITTATGSTTFSTDGTPAPTANITVGDIQAPGLVLLAAPGDVTTGSIQTEPDFAASTGFPSEVRITAGGNITARLSPTNPQPAPIAAIESADNVRYPAVTLTAGGNILAGAIRGEDFSNRQGSVSLTTLSGGIQVNTISAGSGGIRVNAAEYFRAVGADLLVDPLPFGGVVNDPELIQFLVDRGFSEAQLRTSPYSVLYDPANDPSSAFTLTGNGVILVESDQRNYSLQVNVSSIDLSRAVIDIRIGDAQQEIVNQVVESQGRVVIRGDSRQPFRLGPVPNNGLAFIPDLPTNRLEDYNPVTNNFAFRVNASQPLIYPSNLFPEGASGIAGAIAIDDGTNANLVGSLQYRSFDPILPGSNSNPNSNPNSGAEPQGQTGSNPVNAIDQQVVQQSLNRQNQNVACVQAETRVASATVPETRSPNAPSNPCVTTSDEAQILKILGEDGNPIPRN